jgi:uncharacterized protein
MQYPSYDPTSPVTPLTAAELATLDALLPSLPSDASMSLDGMDGYLTALVVGPPALLADLASAEWLPAVWGGDGLEGPAAPAPFGTQRQRKNTVVMVLRHLRHLVHQLHHEAAAWEPIFSVAEQGADELVDARDWCCGFLQAVDLAPDAWGTSWQDARFAPLLALGGGIEGHETPQPAPNLDNAATCDALSRAVPDLVLQLLAVHQPTVSST